MAEQLVDVNVTLGNWPFQRFPVRTAAQLDEHLRSEGIGEAWVASMEGVLYPDPDVHDDPLAAELRDYPHLKFVKTVNPTLGNWKAQLDKADFAIRIYPNYHQYKMSDERLLAMLEEVQQRGLIVQLPLRVDDERNQYKLMMVPGVPTREILAVPQWFPQVRFLVLNAFYHEAAELLGCQSNISVDTAFIERVETLGAFIGHTRQPDRVLFGSYTPMLYTRSGVLKLQTADDASRAKIGRENAHRLRAG